MGWITIAALFFVIWWVMLFASLPVVFRRARNQVDGIYVGEQNAPRKSRRGLVAFAVNTLVTAIIVGALAVAVNFFGLNPDVFPHIIPE
jgi:predicted secreted protein